MIFLDETMMLKMMQIFSFIKVENDEYDYFMKIWKSQQKGSFLI